MTIKPFAEFTLPSIWCVSLRLGLALRGYWSFSHRRPRPSPWRRPPSVSPSSGSSSADQRGAGGLMDGTGAPVFSMQCPPGIAGQCGGPVHPMGPPIGGLGGTARHRMRPSDFRSPGRFGVARVPLPAIILGIVPGIAL